MKIHSIMPADEVRAWMGLDKIVDLSRFPDAGQISHDTDSTVNDTEGDNEMRPFRTALKEALKRQSPMAWISLAVAVAALALQTLIAWKMAMPLE